MTSCYTLIWKRIRCKESAFWISLSDPGSWRRARPAYFVVPGTFDFIDIVVMVLNFVLPYYLLAKNAEQMWGRSIPGSQIDKGWLGLAFTFRVASL